MASLSINLFSDTTELSEMREMFGVRDDPLYASGDPVVWLNWNVWEYVCHRPLINGSAHTLHHNTLPVHMTSLVSTYEWACVCVCVGVCETYRGNEQACCFKHW